MAHHWSFHLHLVCHTSSIINTDPGYTSMSPSSIKKTEDGRESPCLHRCLEERLENAVENIPEARVPGFHHIHTQSTGLVPSSSDIHEGEGEESMSTVTDLFTQYPQLYLESIDSLQSQVFGLGSTAFGDIKQDGTIHVLQLPTAECPVSDTSSEISECPPPLLKRNQDLISATLDGINILSEAQLCETKFCEATYNIIVEDAQRANVLRVVPIKKPILQLLHKLTKEATRYCSIPQQWALLKEVIDDVGEFAASTLHYMGLTESMAEKPVLHTEYHQCLNSCMLLSLTSSVLFLGLVSFVKSHLSFLDSKLSSFVRLRIETPNKPIVMSSERLACLDGFIESPVWAFRTSPPIQHDSNVRVEAMERFQLSIMIADLADLWGPISLKYPDEDQDAVSEIKVRRGVIRRSHDQVMSNSCELEEVPCHWYDDINSDVDHSEKSLSLIPTTGLLLIGHSSGSSSSSLIDKDSRNIERDSNLPSTSLLSKVLEYLQQGKVIVPSVCFRGGFIDWYHDLRDILLGDGGVTRILEP